MEKTDLQTLKNGLSSSINDYTQISLTNEDKKKSLEIVEKEAKIISDEENFNNNLESKKAKEQLDRDHVYFQEQLEKDRFNYQKEKDLQDQKIESLRLEIEKQKVDISQRDIEYRQSQSDKDTKYRWITFGITAAIGFAQFALSLYTYRKLAYTNLNLIYKDEGRPTTDFKDAIQNVKRFIKQ